jgi:hypothetical protein
MKDRISLFVTALLMISALAAAVACSLTIDSGELHAYHREDQSSPETPTPTPAPAAAANKG